LELSTDFASISFMPKSRTALENMKELVLLDLKILLGADIAWSHSGKQPEAAATELAAPAISQGGAGDDDSESSRDESVAPDKSSGQRKHVRRKVVAEHPAGGSPATPAPLRKAAAATPKTPTISG
jgi:hypothetical protein